MTNFRLFVAQVLVVLARRIAPRDDFMTNVSGGPGAPPPPRD